MDARVHLFGIRHHGPGSAASLIAALDALDPAMVLIEGPPEADEIANYAIMPGMVPPVALLLYAREDMSQARFFPFANFSPEWQATRWALSRHRPTRFIDLPASIDMALQLEKSGSKQNPGAELDYGALHRDPLDQLADIAGYSDGESWWNGLVESNGAATQVFGAIETAMTELRQAIEETKPLSEREGRREAYMRQSIRDALKSTDGQIAVVVGAWHVPALRKKIAQSEDKALLKDLAKIKVEATWVPWTQPRLASASGYGAGVISPGWYQHLWGLYCDAKPLHDARVDFAATWQAKVATLLRKEGQLAAPASVIEATRLAITLSTLRGHAMPGLTEMRDATLAALCGGDTIPFQLIETQLVIGNSAGQIDENVPQMPLADDLARWQKKLRLKPEALEQEAALDLRSEAGLAKSTLLHRLTLINVPWGKLRDAAAGRGSFREIWILAWVPEFSVRLAEALVYGVTIEQAAAGRAAHLAAQGTDVAALATLVKACLLADLPEAAEVCIARLQAAAVQASDIAALMEAVPPLVQVLRYGTARALPEAALAGLVRALAGEINAGARLAAHNLDADASKRMSRALSSYDEALNLLDDADLVASWISAMSDISGDPGVVPLIRGLVLRRLYDRSAMEPDLLAADFARALSAGEAVDAAGLWLEGFLGQNAEVMLQDHALQDLVDQWICGLEETQFVEALPLLRRAFSSFAATQRQRLLSQIAAPHQKRQIAQEADSHAPGFEAALPLLLNILGLSNQGSP